MMEAFCALILRSFDLQHFVWGKSAVCRVNMDVRKSSPKSTSSIYAGFAFGLALLPGLCQPARAQTEAGSIFGLITDNAGAVVGGARLGLVDIDRNTALLTESNRAGLYRFES